MENKKGGARPGAGRKKVGNYKFTIVLDINIIEEIKRREGKNFRNYIRNLIYVNK